MPELAKRPPRPIQPLLNAGFSSSRLTFDLTPDQLTRILRSAENGDISQQAQLFEEIEEKDAFLSSLLQTRKLAILGLEWVVKPVDESRKARLAQQKVQEFINNLDIETIQLDALDAIGKGVSLQALEWKYSEGQYILDNYWWVHPRNLYYNHDIRAWQLQTSKGLANIEPGSAILHQYRGRSGSPARAGLLRNVARIYLMRSYALRDWTAFLEVFGQPLRVGRVNPNAPEDDHNAMLEALRSLGSDASAIISSDSQIEIIESNKTASTTSYKDHIELIQHEMSVAILGQGLANFDGNGGSNALARTLDRIRGDIKEADAKALSVTLYRDLITPFCVYNGIAKEYIPKYEPILEEPDDLDKIASYIERLSRAGVQIPARWAMEKFGMPTDELDREAEELPNDSPPEAIGEPLAASSNSRAVLASGDAPEAWEGFVEGNAYLDRLASRYSGELAQAHTEIIRDITRVLNASQSYQEALQGLAAMDSLPNIDHPTLPVLERLLKAARLSGSVSAVVDEETNQ